MVATEDCARKWFDGRQAFRDAVHENPHPIGSPEHTAWRWGYESLRDLKALELLTRALEGGPHDNR